jgi:ubiquinone/menaquinone biosynthesis C-methylase UbiE
VADRYLYSAVHADEAALQRLVEVVRPNGGRVLDVATGAGHVALALSAHVDAVVATDLTKQMLEVTRKTADARQCGNLQYCIAAAEALPFTNASFQGVTCRLAAHHFRDVEAFLSESRRVLSPGGWLLIVDNIGIDQDEAADDELDRMEFLRDPSHVRSYQEPRWRAMLSEAGFRIEFSEVVPKPLNASDWMRRMQVPEKTQENLVELISGSSGWLREYLRPHGEGDLLTFHLHEMVLLAKPS